MTPEHRVRTLEASNAALRRGLQDAEDKPMRAFWRGVLFGVLVAVSVLLVCLMASGVGYDGTVTPAGAPA